MAQVDWSITGTLQVEDFLTPNAELDVDWPAGTATVVRPLAGVRVAIKGSLFDNGPYGSFVDGVTDARGHFRLHARKSDQPRKFVVHVELEDSTLSVREQNLAETLVVYESLRKEEGPNISVGTIVVQRERHTLATHQKALAWYVVKSVIDFLEENGQGFKRKIRVRVPTSTISGAPWARGLASDNVYITPDTYNLVTLIHEVMHLWNYQHNNGVSNWLGAVWGDADTAGFQEQPNIAFHEGFAEYAAWELMHLIWGLEKGLPYSRNTLAVRGFTSLTMVERNWKTVMSCLRMLSAENPAELSVGAAGDAMGVYAEPVAVPAACPTGQLVTFVDVLRVFSPAKAAGWNTEWEVGNSSFGARRFFRRASDILDGFSDTASQLMLDAIDPVGTTQVQDRCADLLVDVPARARVAIANRARSRKRTETRRRPQPFIAETGWRHPVRRVEPAGV
jgi:hypothetical protein